MGDTRDRMGAAGVAVAGGFFKIALYVCVAVLIIWIGKVTYQFGYDIFNQHAMSPDRPSPPESCGVLQILWTTVLLLPERLSALLHSEV